MTLSETLTKPPVREHVVTACVALIDDEVKHKSGFSGVAVKAAYGVVKAVKPRFVSEVVDGMLDEWVAKLEPFHADWEKAGKKQSFGAFLEGKRGDVADALLSVTDSKSEHAKSNTLRKTYAKMRPTAKKHVEEAVPRLGELIVKEEAAAPTRAVS
jgi:hypothetical protein